jgi:hypothetical protein
MHVDINPWSTRCLNDNIGAIRQSIVVPGVIVVVGCVPNNNDRILWRKRLYLRSDYEIWNDNFPPPIPPAIAIVVPVAMVISMAVPMVVTPVVAPVVTPVIICPRKCS